MSNKYRVWKSQVKHSNRMKGVFGFRKKATSSLFRHYIHSSEKMNKLHNRGDYSGYSEEFAKYFGVRLESLYDR